MLKIRYFEIRLPTEIEIPHLTASAYSYRNRGKIVVISSSEKELITQLTTVRQISTVQFLTDGSRVAGVATTMEQHLIRIFRSDRRYFLSLLDPPRGGKLVADLFELLLPEQEYFVASVELQRPVIERHINTFESSKLVSAKVRDFQIYDKAIARLEVSSKEGLLKDIAPFLENRFHRIDSLTYEVTHRFKKGLIQYLANGTVKISPSLVEVGFPSFERELEGT
jgi:hypothetical protein